VEVARHPAARVVDLKVAHASRDVFCNNAIMSVILGDAHSAD
jgi:hypothetical protein